MNKPSTVPIYESDLVYVRRFRDQKKLKNLAEAMRVIVEYANAHGVFQ